jgi:hypothetical protein
MNVNYFLDGVSHDNVTDQPRPLTVEETRQIGGGATLVEYVM